MTTSEAINQPPSTKPADPPVKPRRPRPGWVTALGLRARAWWDDALVTLQFIGEVLLSVKRLFAGKAAMRWSDLFWQIEQAGPRSVAIVALVSGMVGVILAYKGAVQRQRVGA